MKQQIEVRSFAEWIGMITYTANRWHMDPGHDLEASAAMMVAARRAENGGPSHPRRARSIRPPALGGHSLFVQDGHWKCKVCRTSSRKKLPVASASFPGSAAIWWAEKACVLACAGESVSWISTSASFDL